MRHVMKLAVGIVAVKIPITAPADRNTFNGSRRVHQSGKNGETLFVLPDIHAVYNDEHPQSAI